MLVFSSLLTGGTSKPTSYPDEVQALTPRAGSVLKTTVTDSQTIDWISIGSQGEIAQAPPLRTPRDGPRPLSELEQPGAELGPPGTVPVVRVDLDYLTSNSVKSLPGLPESASSKRQTSNAGQHWYVSSSQTVPNIGGSTVFSLFAPYVSTPNDSSLLQTAITRSNVLLTGGRGPSLNVTQTVEAGWINFPSQISQPHLFTYFTTNGYLGEGNNQGGWNTDFAGWVQVDATIHPGSVFSPLSVDGGVQEDLKVEYNLHEGNWWLAVEDRWIGYYPASLFSAVSTDPADTTLAGGSDGIYFYGEVFNSEDALTTTDMGSGEFAEKGYGKVGYFLNATYTNSGNVSVGYEGVWTESDAERYTYEEHFLSGTNMGSYAFLGGPGAGGVVGG